MLASQRNQVNCSFSKEKKYTKILHFLSQDKWETLRKVEGNYLIQSLPLQLNIITDCGQRDSLPPCPEEQVEVEGKEKEDGSKENYLFAWVRGLLGFYPSLC